MNNFRRIEACRICGNTELTPVLDLGEQFLTGVFPRTLDEPVTKGPLELVRCDGGIEACGLVQLRHSFDSSEMYGERYGYRSSLNRSMVGHLEKKVTQLQANVTLRPGDLVLDIGSNDGTTLSFYPPALTRVGIDPAAAKFCDYYEVGIECVSDFFSAHLYKQQFGRKKAKVITSIAMFYDLDQPQEFVNDVAAVLHDEGIWHLEQSYLPLMLETTGYDTICHEHVEYYALAQIEWMMDRAGLRIVDVELNQVNGGSFAVTVCHQSAPIPSNHPSIHAARRREAAMQLATDIPFHTFRERVCAHKRELLALLNGLRENGSSIAGYGASTKGNVILQFCGITTEQIPMIAEVNSDKFGCVTPGTGIPIVSETEVHSLHPDYLLAMPWHFKPNLIEREASFLDRGGKMIFPLPRIEIVGRESR